MISPRSSSGRGRIIRRVLTWLMACLGVGGLAWGAWEFLRPRPSLEDAIQLADAGKLDEAAEMIRTHLADRPEDDAAHLLLAQILLGRPDPTFDRPPTAAPRSRGGWRWSISVGSARRIPGWPSLLQLARGKALDRLSRLDEAEAAWLEALRIEPTAPEAGWNLLNLYYLQGREEEARRLALRLFEVEPDPHDRVLLLLELVKLDARPPAPGSLVKWFEAVVRQNPGDLHSALALGLALTRAGQVERGDRLYSAGRCEPTPTASKPGTPS